MKGRGAALGMPGLLDLTQPITVQLANTEGVCWEAIYSAPAQDHSESRFKDRAD